MTDAISPADRKEPYDQPLLQRHGALLSITGASPKSTTDSKTATDKTTTDTKTTTDKTATDKLLNDF